MRVISDSSWEPGRWGSYMRWCYRNTGVGVPHTHARTFMEMFWVEAGRGVHGINGRVCNLRRGDLVLVRPEDVHSFAAAQQGEYVDFVNVAFRSKIWLSLFNRHFPGKRRYFSEPGIGRRSFQLNDVKLERISHLAAGLREGACDRLAVEAFVAGVLAMLNAPENEPSLPDEMPPWLRHACDQIRLHPNFCGGTATLVRLAGRSPEHVSRACRRFLNERPCDIVSKARMEYAVQEIIRSERTFIDISLDCGIENLGYFYKSFKETYGMPPAAYRRQHHGVRQAGLS